MLYWICSSFFLLELDPFIITNPTSTSDGDYECRLIDLEDDDWDSNRILSCLGVHGGRLKMFDYVSAVNTFFVWDLNVNKEEYHGGFEKSATKNQSQWEEEMGKVMESAPSAQLQSSSESCGEAAGPDE
ncbi:PREDICTED: PRUPE_8G074300 [Prunus dulcis]|uniref:PREDICTED: PRUPE_8G074300 n=1 Tax=Prunus dulcis TaxID=3755 RepID=A0A5E4EZ52_PRUDU|nr:PREDICTED: PRUPE_8G074300 [Prunus dulcis]